MSLPDYKYYLRKPNGSDYDYYYVDATGAVVVSTSATPTRPLVNAPNGWQAQALMWERGFTYFGVGRSHSLGIEFEKDGAKIIRHVYYNAGIEATIQLYIEILDRDTRTYGAYYQGEIDYNGNSDKFDSVTVEIAEGGFLSKLKAKDGTSYEMPINTNPDKIWVKLPSINLQLRNKWIGSANEVVPYDINSNGFPTLSVATTEGTSLYYGLYDQSIASPQKLVQNNGASTNTFAMTHYYDYSVYIQSISGAVPGNFEVGYFKFDSSNAFLSETILYHDAVSQSVGFTTPYLGTVSTNVTLNSGEWISVFVRMYPTAAAPGLMIGVHAAQITQKGSTVTLYDDQATPEGYIECLRWFDVFKYLVEQMNVDPINVSSTLLESTHADKVLFSFDSGRNLENSVLKTNFSEFFESTNAEFNAALFYDRSTNTVSIEEKHEAYLNSQILDLGEVADVEVTAFTDEMCSKIKFGQETYTYDEANGKDESCVESERLMPITRVTSEKNLKSVYRFDPYGIIFNFLNLGGKTITDSDNDNDVAGLHIESSVAGVIPAGYPGAGENYYDVYKKPIDLTPGPDYWDVQNIYSPDKYFNFFFTPTTALYRHGYYLRSLLYGLDSEKIKYQTSGKSKDTGLHLVTDDGVTVIDEGADVPVSSLDNPIFKPFIFDVLTKTSETVYGVLNSNPYGYIRFEWLGNTYYGFLIKASMNPVFRAPQRFKLLATASTDVTKLIR